MSALFGRLVQRLRTVPVLGARRRGFQVGRSDGVYRFTVSLVIHPSIRTSIHYTFSVNITSESGSPGLCQAIPPHPHPPPPNFPVNQPFTRVGARFRNVGGHGVSGRTPPPSPPSPALEPNLKCYPKHLNTETAFKWLQFISKYS